MVSKPPTNEAQALILRSNAARNHLALAASQLRAKLDAPARVRESILAHPGRWLAGATASGLVASKLLFRAARPVRVRKPRSAVFFLLKLASNAVMPAVKIWLLAQIKTYISNRAQSSQPPYSR